MASVPVPDFKGGQELDGWRFQPVGIVGLGLIGGSLGLDLQQRGIEVRGLVHRPATVERARQRGLATQVGCDPALLAPCGMVVLALPLDGLLDPDAALLAALPPQAVITDVGSVKAPVLARWRCQHPRFVASHPMAGNAESGVEAGLAGLFRHRPWVATPEAGTDLQALAAVRELAVLVGARWFTCSAAEHDQAVALISHLPVLVGAALLRSADSGVAPSQLTRQLASSGFADTTRVGGGNPLLGTLMARCNREAVLAALSTYRQRLEALEGWVRHGDWAALLAELEACHQLRPEFVSSVAPDDSGKP